MIKKQGRYGAIVIVSSLLVPFGASALAATISGVVKNEAGQGVANVDIDFIDSCSGDNIFLTNDKTAADGTYSIVVPNGQYDIHYTPPGSPAALAAAQRDNYVVSANANLGTTTLHPGKIVSGTVKNGSGQGVAGVDLKFNDATTGAHIFMGKDVTSATGTYSYRVPPGTWNIDYRPPSTSTFIDTVRTNLVVGSSDISGLVDTLSTGFQLFGTIQDKHNNNIKNVDIDVFDECSGRKIATAHDNSDASGKFSVYVPAGTYTVEYDPPRCKALEALRFPGTSVTRNTDMKTEKMRDAVLVSGRILNSQGVPLQSARLKFFDVLNRSTRQAAADDFTDALGNYSIYMPTSTYNIDVEPPVGRYDLVAQMAGVVVGAATNLGDEQLAAGTPVSGSVVGPSNQPVEHVNINAVDSASRVAVRLAHDSSAADGSFTVVVPNGTFDIQYDPPACTNDAPADQRSQSVSGPKTLATMHLVVGSHATGTVHDTHLAPVPNVDLDFFPVGSTVKSYTPNDQTDAGGAYDTTVQPGSYDIYYIPPSGTRLRPAERPSVSLFANNAIPDTVLNDGWLVSGFVKDNATLSAQPNVTIDFYPPGGTTPAWTPHHVSAADGSYNIAVDAGTWDLLYTPPVGSALAPRWRRSVPVSSDLTLPDTLLLPLTVPTVSAIAPVAGSTAGGATVTISGNGFQPDATVKIGGVSARNVVVGSATSLTAQTGPHPAGKFEVSVINPGNQVGTLAAAYSYNEPATPVRLSVTKSGSSIVLSWLSTGQPSYTVFRNTAPNGFGDSSVLGTTASTSFSDTTSGSGSIQFYQVD